MRLRTFRTFQARAHQMLTHNRDMLDHMAHLVTKLHELELRINDMSASHEHLPLLPLTLQVCAELYDAERLNYCNKISHIKKHMFRHNHLLIFDRWYCLCNISVVLP